MKKINPALFLLCFFCVLGCVEPDKYILSDPAILLPDAIVSQQTETALLNSAEALLDQPPVRITDKSAHVAGSGHRNYTSLATYWWPDPDSEDGLPYIRKDGKVNPETYSEKSDLPKLIEMAQRVDKLTKAYRLTGDEMFSEKAL